MMGTVTPVKISESLEQRIARDFRKSLFTDWDRRFGIILLVTLLFEVIVVALLAQRPLPEYSEREIARIQERFANFILDEAIRQDRNIVSSSSSGSVSSTGEGEILGEAGVGEAEGEGRGGGGTGEGEGSGGGGGRRVSRAASAEARRLSREAISREVSNKGLLGLLTGTGRAAEGEAVSSLFGESGAGRGVGEDLDQVLSSVGGLKTQGESGLGSESGAEGEGGLGLRGERSGRKATIDDLVTDLEDARTLSLSRKGEISIETPEEVVGLGKKSVYRSPEAIQEVLLSHVPAIRYCYERELKRTPALKGKISVRITVSPDGSVKSAIVVSSTMNNERVERCILTRIRRWKDFKPIDPGEGDVTFRQVYTFGY